MIRVHSNTPITLTACLLVSACASYTPPEIDYDNDVPALPAPPPPVVEEPLRVIHTPPPWTPSRGGDADAATAEARVINANAVARVTPLTPSGCVPIHPASCVCPARFSEASPS